MFFFDAGERRSALANSSDRHRIAVRRRGIVTLIDRRTDEVHRRTCISRAGALDAPLLARRIELITARELAMGLPPWAKRTLPMTTSIGSLNSSPSVWMNSRHASIVSSTSRYRSNSVRSCPKKCGYGWSTAADPQSTSAIEDKTLMARNSAIAGRRTTWMPPRGRSNRKSEGVVFKGHATPPTSAGPHLDRVLLRNGGEGGWKAVRASELRST